MSYLEGKMLAYAAKEGHQTIVTNPSDDSYFRARPSLGLPVACVQFAASCSKPGCYVGKDQSCHYLGSHPKLFDYSLND